MPIRILLVENYEPFRQAVSSVLQERSEFQVVGQAADGLQAIYETQKLQPDLIILDISLPKMNGIAAAQEICRLAPKPKILFLSQNDDAEIVKAALSAGGSGYVLKTHAGDQLFKAIEAVIQGNQFISEKLERGLNGTAPWKLAGEVLGACSCDFECPCNFNELPSMGRCEGGWTWHIQEGLYGGVRLNGLNFSIYGRWPGAVHDGNGEVVIFIDDRADNSQWLAITALLEGTAGGPWGLLATTCDKVHGPYGVAYETAFDDVNTRIKCGTWLEIESGPIRDPLTGAESRPTIVLPDGIIFKRGNVGTSVRFRLKRDVQYDHSGKYTAVGAFNYSGPAA